MEVYNRRTIILFILTILLSLHLPLIYITTDQTTTCDFTEYQYQGLFPQWIAANDIKLPVGEQHFWICYNIFKTQVHKIILASDPLRVKTSNCNNYYHLLQSVHSIVPANICAENLL